MSDKKNIIVSIIIFVLFFLLFPLKLVPNLSYNSNESTSLTGDIVSLGDNKIPFIYKNRAGYYSTDLKKSWGMDIVDGVTLLSDSYINRSREKDLIQIRNLEGEIKYSIQDNGYPFSIDDRLYIISRDRKSLSEIVNGVKKWTKVFNYIISSVDANKNSVVIGFIQGFFSVLNSDGEIFFKYEPGGSRVSIIYSVSISNNDRYVAIVSGLDPQRFILYEKKDLEYKPLYAVNLKEDVRKSLKVIIPSDNRSVFIQSSGGYYIIDIESKTTTFTDANYNLKNVQYMPNMDIYMVHSGAVNYNNIKLLTMDNRFLLEKNFIGESVSVSVLNNSLYIIIDNSVIKLDVKEFR